MNDNLFIKDPSLLMRDIDHLANYRESAAFYVSRMRRIPLDEARTSVRNLLNDKSKVKINNPTVHFMSRGENKDSFPATAKLTSYLTHIRNSGCIVAPSFTTYLPPEVEESPHSSFATSNVVRRSISKKEAAVYKAEGNIGMFIKKNNDQNNYKLYNNSLSGAYNSTGTILENSTAHSTLTSLTRTYTSLCNANNDKVLSGHRHYRDNHIALENVIYLAMITEYDKVRDLIDNHGLHVPTVEETVTCIKRSCAMYWIPDWRFDKIATFIGKLSDEERCSVVYISDLYHLSLYNEAMISDFLDTISKSFTCDMERDEAIKYIKGTDEQLYNAVKVIVSNIVKDVKDLNKLSLGDLRLIAGTIHGIVAKFYEKSKLIDTFFVSSAMPVSSSYFDTATRHNIPLSDTDSSMFALDTWVIKRFGELVYNHEALSYATGLVFIVTQSVVPIIRKFFVNIGVKGDKITVPGMKPEYFFPVFFLTPGMKHYFTFKTIQEGNILKAPEMETKGVHLRNSSITDTIHKISGAMYKELLFTIYNNKKISLVEYLVRIADVERDIRKSISESNPEFFSMGKMKSAEVYGKAEEECNYKHHLMWREVFEPKYGKIAEPEYNIYQIPTVLNNKTKLSAWLMSIKDTGFRDRMSKYIAKTNKKAFSTFYISSEFIGSNGVPEELIGVIDAKSIILRSTLSFRLILMALGFFPKNDMTIIEHGY